MHKNRIPLELFFWIIALFILAFAEPGKHHYTLCPLANLGFNYCPGCGLGRSITEMFHGNFYQSWQLHWFAIPTLIILGFRIFQLSRQFLLSLKS